MTEALTHINLFLTPFVAGWIFGLGASDALDRRDFFLIWFGVAYSAIAALFYVAVAP